MALRGLTLITRFALTLYIAKYLGLEAVGVFGLIMGLVSMAPPIVGWAGNYYLAREVVRCSQFEAGRKLRDRLLLSITSLTAGIILYLFFAWLDLAPLPPMIIGTILIVFLDTLACDIQVWLISRHKAVHSNALLFVRTSAWALLLMGLGFITPATRSIDTIIMAWAAFEAAQFILLWFFLRKWPLKEIWRAPVDFAHIRKNMLKGKFVYLNEACLVIALYIDRFIINGSMGLELTGIFMLYWSIANGVNALVSTGILQPDMPHMVAAHYEEGTSKWRSIFKSTLMKTAVSTIIISLAVLAILAILFPLVHVGQFEKYWPFAAMLMVASFFNLLSSVGSQGLATRHLDGHFAVIGFVGLFLSLGLNIVGIHFWGLYGAAFAAIITHAVVLVIKLNVLRKDLNEALQQN